MKTGRLLMPVVGLVSLLAGALLFKLLEPGTVPPGSAATGDTIELHAIPLTALDGGQSVLEDWQAEILVVNFWAPWCAPCRREIPALIEIQQRYRDRGVRVLGIAFDGEAQVRRFAEEYAIDYPLFLSGNRSPMYNAAFDNPSGSLPYTALLDRNHVIRYQHNGELTREQLQQQLDPLL